MGVGVDDVDGDGGEDDDGGDDGEDWSLHSSAVMASLVQF